VIVIAGRPAMGKTAIVLCIAKALCIDQDIPVQIFSLEMDGEQLIHRLLSDLSSIDNNTLSSGDLKPYEENMLNLAQQKITNLFMIDDTPAITIQYLESKVRKAVQKGVKFIIIDYLQLMTLTDKDRKGRNREQEIAFITQNLKRIAKKYKIGVIELSQLSRSCEEREPPRPMLSDLRESGAIEQDADIIILLYRPEYYNIEFTPSGKPSKGLAELIIAKHRNGPVDSVVVQYKGEFTRFEDIKKEKAESFEDPAQLPVF
jgi:replicative DNA helicase